MIVPLLGMIVLLIILVWLSKLDKEVDNALPQEITKDLDGQDLISVKDLPAYENKVWYKFQESLFRLSPVVSDYNRNLILEMDIIHPDCDFLTRKFRIVNNHYLHPSCFNTLAKYITNSEKATLKEFEDVCKASEENQKKDQTELRLQRARDDGNIQVIARSFVNRIFKEYPIDRGYAKLTSLDAVLNYLKMTHIEPPSLITQHHLINAILLKLEELEAIGR